MAFCGTADAHGFGRLYNLPIPFWLYAWGAAAALIASFLVVGAFVSRPDRAEAGQVRDLSGTRWAAIMRRIVPLLQAGSVAVLALCMATGWFGTRDAYRNFSMTFFWIGFVLGHAYLIVFLGDFYARLNPWHVMAGGLARFARAYARGAVAYPQRLGYWPALAFYYLFIVFELFGHGRPHALATALFAYTLLNLAGAGLVGAGSWFRYCEFFSVFFRLVGLAAPLDYRGGGMRARPMFSGLVRERAESISEVAFALFMLSSTAFDGLSATQAWVGSFWNSPLLASWLGKPPIAEVVRLRPWYEGIEQVCLAASPFVYLGAYLGALAIARALTRTRRPLRELALDFAYTLLPIALVYNFTHYYTLLLSQGPRLFALVSDPFGRGWDLFGTARTAGAPYLPDPGWVWHTQVALILAGHVLSVVLAHRVALRVFPARREAVLSQLPILALMVLFTVAGLWILAQPLQAVVSR